MLAVPPFSVLKELGVDIATVLSLENDYFEPQLPLLARYLRAHKIDISKSRILRSVANGTLDEDQLAGNVHSS